jgi:hypothetical protein
VWGGIELSSSLSEATSVIEAVGASLVEKVQVPESLIMLTRREWDKASGPDMIGFGVWRSATIPWGDMRFIIIPCQAHPMWSAYSQPGTPVCYLVPRRAWVPYSMVRTFIRSPSDRCPLPPCWFRSGGAIPNTGSLTPVVWLLVKAVVFMLSGHNLWPIVPEVQNPDKSPRVTNIQRSSVKCFA